MEESRPATAAPVDDTAAPEEDVPQTEGPPRRLPPWLAPSLIGLLGVFVGTVLSVWTTERAESRQQVSEFRIAQRLVYREIKSNLNFANETSMSNQLNVPYIRGDAWESQQVILARDLGEHQWNVLADYYGDVEELERVLATDKGIRTSNPGFLDEIVLGIRESTKAALAAVGRPTSG
jgi:hypothetical protein